MDGTVGDEEAEHPGLDDDQRSIGSRRLLDAENQESGHRQHDKRSGEIENPGNNHSFLAAEHQAGSRSKGIGEMNAEIGQETYTISRPAHRYRPGTRTAARQVR